MRSEHDIDEAIDRAVRDIMAVDPPAGLRRRVLDRLERRAPAWWTVPRVAAAAVAIAIVIVVAAVMFRSQPHQAAAPAVARITLPTQPAPVPPKSGGAAPIVDEPRPEKPDAGGVAFPPQGTVAAATVPEDEAAREPQAQQPNPVTKPAPDTAPRPEPAQPINMKLDLTISDQSGSAAPMKRTVSMIVRDRGTGSIRSDGNVAVEGKGRFNTALNVDAEAVLLTNNRVRLRIGLEYLPRPGTDNASSGEGRGHLRQNLNLIVEPGKPMVISQASDPTADRKIAVELLLTVLK
jgi:hypothetical protein